MQHDASSKASSRLTPEGWSHEARPLPTSREKALAESASGRAPGSLRIKQRESPTAQAATRLQTTQRLLVSLKRRGRIVKNHLITRSR